LEGRLLNNTDKQLTVCHVTRFTAIVSSSLFSIHTDIQNGNLRSYFVFDGAKLFFDLPQPTEFEMRRRNNQFVTATRAGKNPVNPSHQEKLAKRSPISIWALGIVLFVVIGGGTSPSSFSRFHPFTLLNWQCYSSLQDYCSCSDLPHTNNAIGRS
jgi:Ribosome associated membrane protein RAMP4